LNLDLEMPEIVLVGLRGQGKSTLLEAFLGHQFTDVGYGTDRRRPEPAGLGHCCVPLTFLFSARDQVRRGGP
jgi:hypothetical protein